MLWNRRCTRVKWLIISFSNMYHDIIWHNNTGRAASDSCSNVGSVAHFSKSNMPETPPTKNGTNQRCYLTIWTASTESCCQGSCNHTLKDHAGISTLQYNHFQYFGWAWPKILLPEMIEDLKKHQFNFWSFSFDSANKFWLLICRSKAGFIMADYW